MQMCRLILILAACIGLTLGMSRPQLKKTMTIMKTQCMPKNGVTEAQVGKIEQGVFLEERNVMCYIACIYKTTQVVKNNRLDAGLISKQIDVLYPKELKEIVKKGVAVCMPIQFTTVFRSRLSLEESDSKLGLVYSDTSFGFSVVTIEQEENYNDMCEGIFHATKCLYEYDPPNFIFP